MSIVSYLSFIWIFAFTFRYHVYDNFPFFYFSNSKWLAFLACHVTQQLTRFKDYSSRQILLVVLFCCYEQHYKLSWYIIVLQLKSNTIYASHFLVCPSPLSSQYLPWYFLCNWLPCLIAAVQFTINFGILIKYIQCS